MIISDPLGGASESYPPDGGGCFERTAAVAPAGGDDRSPTDCVEGLPLDGILAGGYRAALWRGTVPRGIIACVESRAISAHAAGSSQINRVDVVHWIWATTAKL